MKTEKIMENIQAILDDEAKKARCAAITDKEEMKAFFQENGVEIADEAAQGILDALKGEDQELPMDEEALDLVAGGFVITAGTALAVAGIGVATIGVCYVGGYIVGKYVKQ